MRWSRQLSTWMLGSAFVTCLAVICAGVALIIGTTDWIVFFAAYIFILVGIAVAWGIAETIADHLHERQARRKPRQFWRLSADGHELWEIPNDGSEWYLKYKEERV